MILSIFFVLTDIIFYDSRIIEVVEEVTEKSVISTETGDGEKKETEEEGNQQVEQKVGEHNGGVKKDNQWEIIGEKEVDQVLFVYCRCTSLILYFKTVFAT